MTTPTPAPSPTEAVRIGRDEGTALDAALDAEHAAIFAYGVVAAYAAPGTDALVAQSAADHRAVRGAVTDLLTSVGRDAPEAEPGYVFPEPVADPASAAALAVTVEEDSTVAWRAVVERSSSGTTRTTALDALSGAAVRAARWRAVLGAGPVSVPFPGTP